MRLALLSDLHANLHALDACMAHARAQGAQQFAFLGDLVGYGAYPAQVVERVRDEAGRGALVLQGNHDLLAVAGAAGQTQGEASAAWTHSQLSPAQREFLRLLPLVQECGDAVLVHASMDAPPAWHYVTNAVRAQRSLDASGGHKLVFGGHVHEQRLFYAGRRGTPMPFEPTPGVAVPLPSHRHWLATVGSVGQPRDGDPRAMYALWDAQGRHITFHRVPYAVDAAATAIRAAGLPDSFATRLGTGR